MMRMSIRQPQPMAKLLKLFINSISVQAHLSPNTPIPARKRTHNNRQNPDLPRKKDIDLGITIILQIRRSKRVIEGLIRLNSE